MTHSKAPAALGPVAGAESPQEKLARVRFVLVATSHPGNIGASARAMKAMGLDDLVLVNPKRFPDPEAVALASGADDLLDRARVVATLSEALEGTVASYALSARRRELSHRALTLREATAEAVALTPAPALAERALAARPQAMVSVPARAATAEAVALAAMSASAASIAFVFGTEMSGLSNEELILCQALVHIPVNPQFSSLNLSQAVQLVAYELRLAAAADAVPQTAPFPLARHEDVERLCEHLEQTLLASGFLDPWAPRRLMERFRRLFARARLEQEEVNILRGVLTSMRAWAEGRPKIRHPR